MKNIRKKSGILLLCLITGTAIAQTKECSFRKSFPANDISVLKVIGKYGEVKINSSQKDSVIICSTITIRQNNEKLREESLSLIKTGIKKTGDTVYVVTSYDNRFFSPPLNKDRINFSVDYSITMPSETNLEINNSFGNVFIDNCEGYVNISVSHGNINTNMLSRGNIRPVNVLNADYGSINVAEANWLLINTVNCPSINIGNAKAVVTTSRFSKISAGTVNSIVCDSKSDMVSIGSANNVVLKGVYTAFNAGNIGDQLVADTQYGSLAIDNLANNFSTIDIKSVETPISIKVARDASFNADMTLSGTRSDISNDTNSNLITQQTGGITKVSGFWGDKKPGDSLIKIRASGGSIELKD